MRPHGPDPPGRLRRAAARLAAVGALVVVLAAAGGAAAPARAAFPPTPAEVILSRAVSPADLRARLDSLASATATADPIVAGEARYYQGMSFARGGQLDSAIVAYRSAVSLRHDREELLELADVRLLRQAPGDAAAVLLELAPALAEASGENSFSQVQVQRRLAWAHFLAGHADTAAALFSGTEDMPGLRLEWRYRMALPALETGAARKAFEWLFPVAVASRKQDPDVMRQLERAARAIGGAQNPGAAVDAELRRLDMNEQRLFESWGGRRVLFAGTDGFPLLGFVVPARESSRPARAVGAVVLMAPTDTLAAYDSLAITLREHGIATILVPARGSNWAVAPGCPLPEAWEGREEQLQHQSARDVRRALGQLAAATPIDTTRYLVVGVSSTSVSAVEAARLDRRVRALLIVSPFASPVDRGPMCADLAATRVPAFFQIALEEFDTSSGVADLLYQAGNRSASRVVEGTTAGTGAAQYRADATLLQRFLGWLEGALKAPPPARATPRAARRKG